MTRSRVNVAARFHNGLRLFSILVAALAITFSMATPSFAKPAVKERIVISGASGQVGEMVVEQLLKLGVPAQRLILVSRSPDKLKKYADMGASVRFGDVDQPESLPAAYAGGTKLLFISLRWMPGSASRAPRQKVAFDAAAKAGVKHIVYTSMLEADTTTAPFGVEQRVSEEDLKATGVSWTALRYGIYAEYAVGGHAAQMLDHGKVTLSPDEFRIVPVTREDCAAVAAAVLTTPGHEGKAYEITGSDVVGRGDVAALASALSGKPIEVTERAGAPIPYDYSYGKRPPLVSNAVQKLTGRPPTTMRDFLAANMNRLNEMPQDNYLEAVETAAN